MQVHEEITGDEDLYEDKEEKYEVRSATSLLDIETKDDETVTFIMNPEEAALVTEIQVMGIGQRAIFAEGNYIRSKLDKLKAEIDLLEKRYFALRPCGRKKGKMKKASAMKERRKKM